MYQNSNYSYVESSSIKHIKKPRERSINDWSFLISSNMPDGSIRRLYKNDEGKYEEYIMGSNEGKFIRTGNNVSEEEIANIQKLIEKASRSRQIADSLQALSKKDKNYVINK